MSGSRVTQLFKLAKDPWEIDNLADFPEYRETVASLRSEMKRQAVEIGDESDESRTSYDFWSYFEANER